ncbi:Ig-like domain-containing protein [Patescibacteria group bacterium]
MHEVKGGHARRTIVWSVVSTMLFFIAAVFWFFTAEPSVTITHDTVGEFASTNTSVQFIFSRPFSREVIPTIEPFVAGNWDYGDFIYSNHLARSLVFTPEVSLAPEMEYQISIAGVRNALTPQSEAQTIVYTFTTPPVPTVSGVSPSQEDILAPAASWTVMLDGTNDGLASFEFVFEPEVTFIEEFNSSKTSYTITPSELLKQGTDYQLTVYKRNVQYFIGTEDVAYQSDPEEVFVGSWKTRDAPGIVSFSPTGTGIRKGTEISIEFSESMDRESVFLGLNADPTLTGLWIANSENTIFTNYSTLTFGVQYSITIEEGVQTSSGGYLEEDAEYQFTTLGNVRATRFSPVNAATGASIGSTIQITFDQNVDHFSAEGLFSISPSVDGSFSWNGNTMIFDPADALDFNTQYSVSIGSGVVSVEALNSTESYSFSFTTELSQTKLAVVFHRQERPLSCEAATLVMALRYKGVNVSESTLIDQIGIDPTPHENGVWGNPHIAFVGDYYGRQSTTGYGVYWQPIARVGNLYRTSRWFTGGTIQDLTTEIQNGNPVIVWGNAGSGTRVDWKTSDGDNVVAINGEHTRIVTGFVGSAENPTSIIVLDPLYGEKYYTTSAFESNWLTLGKAGVVVE